MQCGLSTKLIAYVTAGVLLTSAVIGLMRVRNERGPLSALIDGASQSIAQATAAGAAALVAGYDYGNLEILARNVSRQPHVVRVVIRNADGRIMVEASAREADAHKRFATPVVLNGRPLGQVTVDVSTAVLENALQAMYWRVFVEQLAFGAVLGLIVYLFTACGIVSPIRRLTATMEEAVAQGGSFIARDLDVASADEIGRLVSVFNTLNQSLARYHGQLQSRIDLANQELRDKNEALHGRTHELEHALKLLGTMASTDGLTELPNRRKFDETLAQMFHQATRFAEPLTLVLFDVDRFKQINDSHGHGAGDDVLRTLGALLQRCARKSDLPARLGGDEFGILLYHTDSRQAEQFVRKLVDNVRTHDFSYQGVRLQVSLSVGIAEVGPAMNMPQSLYFAADRALYASKNGGRDRCTVHPCLTEE